MFSNQTLQKICNSPEEFARELLKYAGTDTTEVLIEDFWKVWAKEGCHK